MQRAGGLEGLISRSLATEQGGSQSNSVRRALAILEVLKDSDRRRNLSEISRKLSLPKSTTSVLLSTLAGMGYVTRDATERRYSLTTKSHGLGLELLSQLDLSRRSRTMLESIAVAVTVTAHLAVLDGDQVLFVNKVDCVQQPCCDIYPGRKTDLQCTAVGKILLAYLSEEEQRAFLARHRSIRHTSRTIRLSGRITGRVRLDTQAGVRVRRSGTRTERAMCGGIGFQRRAAAGGCIGDHRNAFRDPARQYRTSGGLLEKDVHPDIREVGWP